MVHYARAGFFGALVSIWLLPTPSSGQIEPIGPITIVGNQPVDLFFVNDIPPNPDRKLLDFLGEAINNTSSTVQLDVMYDWIDMAGIQQFSPVSTIAIPPGGPWPVDPGPFVLNFCPQDVSLHFAMEFGEIDLQGEYGHICFPVPEPGLSMLACMAVVLPFARRGLSKG